MKREIVVIHYPYMAIPVVVVEEAKVEVVVHYVEKFWEIKNEAYERNTLYLHFFVDESSRCLNYFEYKDYADEVGVELEGGIYMLQMKMKVKMKQF